MTYFRALLAVLLAGIIIYTAVTVSGHGIDLLTPYFSQLTAFTWQGQFNYDFGSFLVLTGVWLAWRGGFTTGSILFGAIAPLFGMVFLAAYLLWLSFRTNGDMQNILMGVHARH